MTNPTVNNRYIVPDLAEFLSRRMADIATKINCLNLGTIVSFNATNQTAVVSVNFQRIVKGINPLPGVGEESDQIISFPTLVDVPILFMNGGGGYLTFPIIPGDTCILLFCDRDMDVWFATGQVVPPNSERVHSLNDAIAIVGIRDLQKSLTGYSTTKVQLNFPEGLVTVTDLTGERLNQAGFLQPYAGSTAPSGWLLCYGQAISRTAYATLFSVIGTTYGSGDGSTTFNVPDLRGRTVAGLDNMGGSSANVLTNAYNPNRNTLGGATGEEAHQLSIPEMPTHNHPGSYIQARNDNSGAGFVDSAVKAQAINDSITAFVANQGSDTPHQNVQPSRMVNWIIKL